jgi:hypothetical protein
MKILCWLGYHDYRVNGKWKHWDWRIGNYGDREPGSVCPVKCHRCDKPATLWQCYATGLGSLADYEWNFPKIFPDEIGALPPYYDFSSSKSRLIFE